MDKDKKDKSGDNVSEDDVSRREFFVKALASAPVAAGVALAADAAVAGGQGGANSDDEDDREDGEDD